jgi:ELWxxDGT repeat protein
MLLPNVVLFQGTGSGQVGVPGSMQGLWETNGTATGTSILTIGPFHDGFENYNTTPLDLTVFNDQVLFTGRDTTGGYNLWTTNGGLTPTLNTTEVADHDLVPSASSTGLFSTESGGLFTPVPADLTVFGSQVLFNGLDSAGDEGLWTTNGTAAGTHEVSLPSSAVAASGVNPSDITVFNGEALFNGADTAGDRGLWVTNGTGAGTHELTGISGAATTGIDPSNMVVYDGEVLFNGADGSGNGLWVTNGTAAGTQELMPGIDPTDMVVYGGEVLFAGKDGGNVGLWETNGTPGGTKELIAAAAGATVANDPLGLDPSDLTVFNGEVLFSGLDQFGHPQLWATNGTPAGTSQLSSITTPGTFPHQGLEPSNLEVYDGQVLFSGLAVHGSGSSETSFQGLWTTNGTAAGTKEITPIADGNSGGLFPVDLTDTTPKPTPPNFFNYNPKADILWQNTNGDVALWNSNPGSGSESFADQDFGIIGGGWQIAGTGDFAGNGESSVLWRNTNGDTALWNPNGSGGFTFEDLGIVGNSWQIAGTGDFAGDGESILWQNTNGDTALWNPNGSGGFAFQDLGVVGGGWQIAGTGDFTGTGEDSILWRNANGDTALWNPNGSGGFTLDDLGVVGGGWQIAGTGDFTGTGKDSILWQNTNGDTALWNPNGSGGFSLDDLGVVGGGWQIAGTGNYTGTGQDSILWQNTNGDKGLWNPNGSGGFTFEDLGNVGASWSAHKIFT